MVSKDDFLASLDPQKCSLCLEPYDSTHVPVDLECGHVFGDYCIANAVESETQNNNRCPLCRRVLFEQEDFDENGYPLYNDAVMESEEENYGEHEEMEEEGEDFEEIGEEDGDYVEEEDEGYNILDGYNDYAARLHGELTQPRSPTPSSGSDEPEQESEEELEQAAALREARELWERTGRTAAPPPRRPARDFVSLLDAAQASNGLGNRLSGDPELDEQIRQRLVAAGAAPPTEREDRRSEVVERIRQRLIIAGAAPPAALPRMSAPSDMPRRRLAAVVIPQPARAPRMSAPSDLPRRRQSPSVRVPRRTFGPSSRDPSFARFENRNSETEEMEDIIMDEASEGTASESEDGEVAGERNEEYTPAEDEADDDHKKDDRRRAKCGSDEGDMLEAGARRPRR